MAWMAAGAIGSSLISSLLPSLLGGGTDGAGLQKRLAKNQLQLQQAAFREMTEMDRAKIGYTVMDARRSGISPLVALGSPASGAMFSPVGGGIDYQGTPNPGIGSAVGDALGSLGSSLSTLYQDDLEEKDKVREAAEATRQFNEQQKMQGRQNEIAAQQNQIANYSAQKENELKDAMIAETRSRTLLNNTQAASVGGPAMLGGSPVTGNPTQTTIPFTSAYLRKKAGASDAQDVANKYGDIISEFYGGARLLEDIFKGYGTPGTHGGTKPLGSQGRFVQPQ